MNELAHNRIVISVAADFQGTLSPDYEFTSRPYHFCIFFSASGIDFPAILNLLLNPGVPFGNILHASYINGHIYCI